MACTNQNEKVGVKRGGGLGARHTAATTVCRADIKKDYERSNQKELACTDMYRVLYPYLFKYIYIHRLQIHGGEDTG